MRRIKAVLAVFMIIISIFMITDTAFDIFTRRATATTIYVGSGPGNDSANIQGAINLADPGDTIFVYAGMYNESLFIDKTLTLLGEDKNTTIVNMTGNTYGIHLSNADYINISGFTTIGGSYNVYILSCNYSHIHGNILENAGIALGIRTSHGNLIENNYLIGNTHGISISDRSSANILRNNVINFCSGRAILVESQAHDNLIFNNNISGYYIGIYIYESENNRIENNHISNGVEGFRILDLNNILLSNNIISDNDYAIYSYSASAMIINCTLQNSNLYDIQLDDPDSLNPQLILINTSFYKDKVSISHEGSTLIVRYYLHVKVINAYDEPLPDITVRVQDNENGSFDENHTTDSEGYVKWIPLTQYVQNHSTNVYYTPYNITVSNTTSLGFALPEVVMNTSKEVTIKVLSDTDSDGVFDINDDFPNDPTQWLDSDGDGYGDNASGNDPDAFPDDQTQWQDSDNDGYGDNKSGNNPDAFPEDYTQWKDSDGDGWGDNKSGNKPDAFPDDPKEWKDTDGDGVGDNSDFLPSLDNSVFFLIVGAVVIVVIILLFVLFSKRRKKPAKWKEEEQNKE